MCEQMTRELIGTAVEIAITQNDAASDDGIVRREADAGFLEKMIEPLARSPADCIACMLAYYTSEGGRGRRLRSDQAAVVRAGATRRPSLLRRGRHSIGVEQIAACHHSSDTLKFFSETYLQSRSCSSVSSTKEGLAFSLVTVKPIRLCPKAGSVVVDEVK